MTGVSKLKVSASSNPVILGKGELRYLIVMPLFQSHPDDSYYFPLGVPYLSSAMKKAGFKVFTLNLNHKKNPYKVLRERIEQDDITVVMTGAISPQYSQVDKIFKITKEVNPNILTVAGGGIVSADPISTMTALDIVDYGIIGEGENTIVELCSTLEKGGNLSEVKGIIFKTGTDYLVTDKRPEIEDIDTIPFPDYEGFEYDKYLKVSSINLSGQIFEKAATLLTSRSCPYNCSFCFCTIGKKYRVRSLDNVFAELDYLIDKYDIKFVGQVDDLFSISHERIKSFCERIKEYNLPWQTIFRIPDINEKNIELLKKSNCKLINTGIESADNSILKSMGKGTTIDQIESALDVAYKMKMPVNGCFIFGDTNETRETAQTTLDWWRSNLKYGILIKMIKVFPGTGLYQVALEKGIISDPVEFLKQGCPPVNVSKMSDEELGELVTQITLLPYEVGAKLQNVEIVSRSERNLKINGNCDYCGEKINNHDYRPFAHGRINCPHCQGAHVVTLPQPLFDSISLNLKELTKSGKVALWGMADYAVEFVMKITKNFEELTLIDLSEEKQLMLVNGQRIQKPSVLKEQGITNVVVIVPDFLDSITHTIEQYYQGDAINIYPVYDLFESVN